MPQWFKLSEENFSEKDQEQQWTYACLFAFTFKKKTIKQITITDHYQQKPGREMITNALILNLLKEKLNGRKRMKPHKKHGQREVYVWEQVPYQGKHYLLVFWFENSNSDWLWVRNCYPSS